jgi:hypothetical protein
MTDKEKAKELVTKYYDYVSGWTSTNRPDQRPSAQYEGEKMKTGRAIQCALIAVEQIETALTDFGQESDELQNMDSEFRFWDKVKNSIKSMERQNGMSR